MWFAAQRASNILISYRKKVRVYTGCCDFDSVLLVHISKIKYFCLEITYTLTVHCLLIVVQRRIYLHILLYKDKP